MFQPQMLFSFPAYIPLFLDSFSTFPVPPLRLVSLISGQKPFHLETSGLLLGLMSLPPDLAIFPLFLFSQNEDGTLVALESTPDGRGGPGIRQPILLPRLFQPPLRMHCSCINLFLDGVQVIIWHGFRLPWIPSLTPFLDQLVPSPPFSFLVEVFLKLCYFSPFSSREIFCQRVPSTFLLL